MKTEKQLISYHKNMFDYYFTDRLQVKCLLHDFLLIGFNIIVLAFESR